MRVREEVQALPRAFGLGATQIVLLQGGAVVALPYPGLSGPPVPAPYCDRWSGHALPDSPSAGRWSAAVGSHAGNRVGNRVGPGVYGRRQASKRFLPRRQNEDRRVPRRSTAASAVRIGRTDRNGHSTARIARQRHRARSAILSFSVPSVIPRSVSVLKIACFKPRDHLTSSIVAHALRPHTQLTARPN